MTAAGARTLAARSRGALAWRVLRAAVLVLFSSALALRAAVSILDTYYSPKNKERPVRSSTRFIILHTTEGSLRGSGSKLQKNGEAHYMVDTAGRIYRIIDRKRVAYHCGRSMWNGLSSLDNYSVGIEVVGFHDKDPTAAQCTALKNLLNELKKAYKISDDKVLTHSMVAYGAPNQWHKRSHRGRKRCAMRMALPSVRKKLGLASKPSTDPDVKAGRLVVADRELQQLLYSVEKKPAQKTPARTPPPKTPAPKPSDKKPPATPAQTSTGQKPSTGQKQPTTPRPTSGQKPASGQGAASRTPAAAASGVVDARHSPWDIAKTAYNAPTTLYEFPDGTQKTGAEITNWKLIPSGTKVTVGGARPEPSGDVSVAAATPAQSGASGVGPAIAQPRSVQTNASPASAGVPSAQGRTPSGANADSDSDSDSGSDAPVSEEEATARYAAKEAELSSLVIGPNRSAWDIARDAYNAPTTIYEFPSGIKKTGAEITNWRAIPAGTRVTLGEADAGNEPEPVASLADAGFSPGTLGEVANAALAALAGAEWNSERTIYVQPDGTYFKGNELDAAKLAALSPETKVFSGYKVGGPVTAKTPAFAICGPSWRDEGTHFLLPGGEIVTGDKIDAARIPPRTMVLYKD